MQNESNQGTNQHESETPVDLNEETTETQETQAAATDTPSADAQVAEIKDKYLRLLADFENFRRRTAKEKIEFQQTAEEGVILAIIPVLDDFERALKSIEKAQDINSVKEGVQLIYHKLYKTLEQRGLKPMEAIGKEFNGETHEAITQIPAPTEDLKGKVVDEVEKGYSLKEKIIRFAKVIVGN
ncbi:nucleotide exchange factor GrpE [Xanthocytophaga agilis]|uniref:Protein GrpE n=1 Tax=Xanthocytophaga agilis TaxID=3048010 RepID=A0AAE3R0E4_9BACT|nr:nucleotide exchange factor GrpE [Xanthocytophaga agilis]MDJ1499105.1 nucleotide exchange factor GrpE [Xanthocytophaga agilis]